MAKAIGLDIGSRTVKLVELDGSPKKFRVSKFVVRDIPGDGGGAEGEVVTETIAAVLKEAKALKDTITAAIDSGTVVIREILVPFRDEDQIRRVLRYEAEAHLHNFAIEDVVVDYVKVGEVQDQSKILIFAAPKDRVRERIGYLNGAGVDPMHLGLDLISLFNAAKATGAFERNPDAVILDMGATTTSIVFVRDGELKGVRSLRSGSESVTRVLAQELSVDTDSAREMSARGENRPRDDDLLAPLDIDDDEDGPETEKTASQLETAIVQQRHDDFLGRLHRETTRSLAAYSVDLDVGAIYVTGGASRTSGIRERLRERFELPVEYLDFLGDGDHAIDVRDHDKANAQIGVAMGCALRGLGEAGLVVEFRRDDLRYTRKFDLIKVSLACTVSLVFLLLFLSALKTVKSLENGRNELQSALRYLNDTYVSQTKADYQTVLGDEAKKLPAETKDLHLALPTWMSQLNTIYRHIRNDMGYDVQDIPPIRSALVIWNDVFKKLAEVRDQLGYVLIEDIDVKQKRFRIRGLIGDRQMVDVIAAQIESLGYVENLERDRTEVDKATGQTRFGITADLAPEQAKGKQ